METYRVRESAARGTRPAELLACRIGTSSASKKGLRIGLLGEVIVSFSTCERSRAERARITDGTSASRSSVVCGNTSAAALDGSVMIMVGVKAELAGAGAAGSSSGAAGVAGSGWAGSGWAGSEGFAAAASADLGSAVDSAVAAGVLAAFSAGFSVAGAVVGGGVGATGFSAEGAEAEFATVCGAGAFAVAGADSAEAFRAARSARRFNRAAFSVADFFL